jgi:hypothetical protein
VSKDKWTRGHNDINGSQQGQWCNFTAIIINFQIPQDWAISLVQKYLKISEDMGQQL